MKDLLFPTCGGGGGLIGIKLGLVSVPMIDVTGLVNALLCGIIGAIGGLIVSLVYKAICKRYFKKKQDA